MRPYRILIVEDDLIVTSIYQKVLSENKFEILIEDSVKKALSQIKNFDPDILLTDVYLPDGNGIELCSDLNKSDEFIPKIIVTADTNIETLRQAYEAGATDFITKPFNEMELIFRIENALRIKTLLKQASLQSKAVAVNDMGLSLEHYVGQYLTAIKGACKLIDLKFKPENKDLQEMLELISDSADGLEETVQKFRNLDEKYSTKNFFNQTRIIELD